MTLTSAQNLAAKQHGFLNWSHACTTSEVEDLDYLNELAMSIYKKNRKASEIIQDDRLYQKRIIKTLVICFIASALIWALGIKLVRWWNAPTPGDRDFSGYGAYEDRRY